MSRPVIDWPRIESMVQTKAPESESLDFKAAFWPEKEGRVRSEEIAKDLVAFMNARGGNIIVGIIDEGDAAAGFSTATLPNRADQLVRQAAEKHLVPREAADGVHVEVIRGREGEVDRELLVVHVDPWPHGPAALRSGQGSTYRLPIRRGTHTQEMSWEDAMRGIDATHRRTRLQLGGWHDEHPQAGAVGPGHPRRMAKGSTDSASVEVDDGYPSGGP